MRLLHLAAGALTLACLTSAVAGLAQPEAADAGGEDEPAVAPLAIVIEGAAEHHAALRQAILDELATSDDPDAARRIEVKIGDELIDVRFTDETGHTVGRKLERPDDDLDMIELVALMSGNLARDQAGALLAELQGPPTPDEGDPPTDAPPASLEKEHEPPPTEPPSRRPRSRKRPPEKPPRTEPPPTPLPAAWRPPLTPAQAALVSPIGIFPDGIDRRFAFDFSALFGRSGGLNGFGLHGLGTHVHGDVVGANLAGAWAYREGALAGFSLAGVFHAANAVETRGVEIGGAANLDVFGERPSHLTGLQLAGIVNAAGGVRGAQWSGAINLSLSSPEGPNEVSGSQIAGVVNVAGDLYGSQIGGVSNVARNGSGAQLSGVSNHAGELSGVQIAGAVNTADEIRGLQLGLVNVAGKVTGAQIGLINIAEENDGAAIGLLNFAKNGRVQLALWGSIGSLSNVGLKMRVGPLFVQPSAGFHPFGATTFSGQVALGGHIPLDPVFIEVMGAWAHEQRLDETDASGAVIEGEGHQVTRLLVHTGAHFGEYFGVFGGGGALMDITQTIADNSADIRPEVVAGILLF